MDVQQAKRFERLEGLAAKLSFLLSALQSEVTEDFDIARRTAGKIVQVMDEIAELRTEIAEYNLHGLIAQGRAPARRLVLESGVEKQDWGQRP